jgi:hypothetical protein
VQFKSILFVDIGPSRGLELGSTKFRNTESTQRNFTIHIGEGVISTQYHKARASTGYSFYVDRFLPKSVATLIVLYLIYIRPFAAMLFNNILSIQKKNTVIAVKKTRRSVQKQAGQRRIKKRRATTIRKNDETLDIGYIFCSDETPNKCWTGVELSEILQKESLNRLGVRINLWAWWHIIIGITKTHLEQIAPFFPVMTRLAERYLSRIYTGAFSPGRPDIKKGSVCQYMVWMLPSPVEISLNYCVYIVESPEYGIIGWDYWRMMMNWRIMDCPWS